MAQPLESFTAPNNLNSSNLHDSGGFFVPDESPLRLVDLEDLPFEKVVTKEYQPTEIIVGNAKVKVTLEEPANTADLKHEATLLIAHGILGSAESYEEFRHALSARGWRVATYTPARTAGIKDLHPDHLLHPEKLLGQALHGAIRGIHDKFGYEQFSVIVHSMGGLTLQSFLEHFGDEAPEFLETAIYFDAVGLNKEPLVTRGRRFLGMIASQVPPYARKLICNNPRQALKVARGELLYIFPRPARFIGEMIASQACDNTETIIKARQHGMRVGGIALTQSIIFPAKAVMEQSSDLFDIFELHDGTHIATQDSPEAAAGWVDAMATKLHEPFAGIS